MAAAVFKQGVGFGGPSIFFGAGLGVSWDCALLGGSGGCPATLTLAVEVRGLWLEGSLAYVLCQMTEKRSKLYLCN